MLRQGILRIIATDVGVIMLSGTKDTEQGIYKCGMGTCGYMSNNQGITTGIHGILIGIHTVIKKV